MTAMKMIHVERPEQPLAKDVQVGPGDTLPNLPVSNSDGTVDVKSVAHPALLPSEQMETKLSYDAAHRSSHGQHGESTVRRRVPSRETLDFHVSRWREEQLALVEKISASLPSAKEVVETITIRATLVFAYISEVTAIAFHILRRPLSVLLCVYIFALGVTYTLPHTPICILPFISSLTVCKRTPPVVENPILRADFPNLVRIQGKTVDVLLSESQRGSATAFHLTKAEVATGNLITLVRHSDLRSRESMVNTLNDMLRDASFASDCLHRFDAKVQRAVDHSEAINEWALRSIEDAKLSNAVSIFAFWKPRRKPTEKVTRAFSEAADAQSKIFEDLVVYGETCQKRLGRLDEHFLQVGEHVFKENISISEDQHQLLSSLWTALGGNKKELRKINENLHLLDGVQKYTQEGRRRIHAALMSLRGMKAEIVELTLSVTTPAIAGSGISMDVHARSLQEGISRLRRGRNDARYVEEEMMHKMFADD